MKKFFLLILMLLLLTGCSSFSKEVKEKRNELINNIGITTEDKIVVKNKKGTQYYVYDILNEYSYVCYLYIFHKNEKKYDEYISNKEDVTYYNLKKYDEIYVTKVKYIEASIREDEDIKEVILKKYTNDDNYKILK